MRWVYDGYPEDGILDYKNAVYLERRIYKCPFCGWSVRVLGMEKPPGFCPNCKTDMWEGEDGMNDDEIIRQELEQKCWFPPKSNDAAKHLNDLIFDINPVEICSQIESDNLKRWCETIQTEMKMAMVQLPCWRAKDEA